MDARPEGEATLQPLSSWAMATERNCSVASDAMNPFMREALLVAAIATLGYLQPTTASAQLFWDWGGDEQPGASGRKLLRFDPQFGPGEVVVSFGDRRLYYVISPGEAMSYPIAIPRDEDRWEGVTTVSDKKINPAWRPTADMLAENPRLPPWVPGGHPMNPLGVRALYLGSSTYRIHGTDAPWTIGAAVSKGCIRMYNQDVLDLFPRVSIGTKVTVSWQRYTSSSDLASRPRLRAMHRSDLPQRF
jgi:lipoprotein-anchoring transpeptidase ErfK/SrfK